ncbi:hypothetical protein NQ315_001128 [Exocentrus adspersus]|uniref:Uncharacterized protein n=1 Tax=Exocentrus adspersus TaxID=1586481 RepID=A0AAV8WF35_9CUCU|nr:hypothetical protein NQ315_001128 [Exocentrus adspersus]
MTDFPSFFRFPAVCTRTKSCQSGSGGFSGGAGGGSGGRQIPILKFDAVNEGEGPYSYSYETGNGIQAQEQGDARGDGTRAQGGFSYTAPDGQQVRISYTADENGFVPQGSHIPTPPPIPAEIQRAIEQNLAEEARGVVDDGQYREDNSGQYRADSSGQNNGGGGAGAGFGAGSSDPRSRRVCGVRPLGLPAPRVGGATRVAVVGVALEVAAAPVGRVDSLVVAEAPEDSAVEQLEVGAGGAGGYGGGAAGGGAGGYGGGGAGGFGGGAGGGAGGGGGRPGAGSEIPIIRYENNNNGDGTYNWLYETGNGINAQEQGDARGDGTKAQGGFSYTAPDGQQIQIQYTADENGFQPQGAHLPTPPPIPEEIQRAIEQNLADEARGIVDDGQYKPGAGEGGAAGGGGGGRGGGGYGGGGGGAGSSQYGGAAGSGQGGAGGYRSNLAAHVNLARNLDFVHQVVVALALVGICACARLDSKYLPPNQGGGGGTTYNGPAPGQGPQQQQPQPGPGGPQPGQYSGQGQGGQQQQANQVPILRLENNNNGDGTYNYALETGDGISIQEQGDASGDGTKAQGGFSYTAPDGQQIQIQYTADENGFQPQGDHLPTPPPIPPEIQRAIDQNLADEANGIVDDGQYRDESGGAQAGGYGGQQQQGQSGGYGGQQQQGQFGGQTAAPGGQAGYKY